MNTTAQLQSVMQYFISMIAELYYEFAGEAFIFVIEAPIFIALNAFQHA